MAGHTTLFAESFAALADAEEVESLTKAMHEMADVEARVARLHSRQVLYSFHSKVELCKQERRDFYDFSEIIHDYVAICGAVKVNVLTSQGTPHTF